ncbi:MAG: hypothetical protein RIS64_4001 [Bacteroidota bacterium]|jgi:tyrosinase
MIFLRKNVWNNGGTFDNTNLLWYAKAVGVMKSKPISDPTSWWFYATIHDEYLISLPREPGLDYLRWKNIASLPQDKLAPLPPKSQIDMFWKQCTHSSWFFLPWHRGYLAAIENILRDIITKELGGPSDWALPYWNYLKVKENQNQLPPAFKQPLLEGKPNPLFVPERYGNDFSDLNDKCQGEISFSIYGGPTNNINGAIENNPHGFGHDAIGSNNGTQDGIMGHVPTAALDPIFYLHHCNIDRMWAAWNQHGNNNPTDSKWLTSFEARKPFAMPLDKAGTTWHYISKDVTSTNIIYYGGVPYQFTYDDLSLFSDAKTKVLAPTDALTLRLDRLNPNLDSTKITKKRVNPNAELVGASGSPLQLNSGKTETKVKLDTSSWGKVGKSLLGASATKLPNEVYLQLEGVKGTAEVNILSVFVNHELIEKVSLFGLNVASVSDGHHGGAGLTFNINITHLIDKLHLDGKFDVNDLDIQIETKRPLQVGGKITIERIGVYRSKQ